MKALMLAAGVGARLYGEDETQPAKALLTFGGRTLLERNIDILRANGVDELILVIGYRKEDVMAEAIAVGGEEFVSGLFNPRYRDGPMISLWTGRKVLRCGDDVLFMDADVLYHPGLIQRLVESPHEDCFLIDRHIEEGEDPVRVCLRDGHPVDFGKQIEGDFDHVGEWPGFLRMSPRIAARVADAAQAYMDAGNTDVTYERAMRDVLVDEPPGTFGCADVSDLPWIEIDFPSDLLRAEKIILPRIATAPLTGLSSNGKASTA